jgi:nucleoside-diphosphate-sugar epimerase
MVTGGFGYKGSVLVPKLLRAGHEVTIFDTAWFGKHIDDNLTNLNVILGDLRALQNVPHGIDAVIHLAGIANDPCGELDAQLTWEVNVLYHQFLIEKCIAAGVKQFIYASSASVYGIQGDRAVTEDTPKAPVSDYNKSKMVAERVLLSYADKIQVQIVRPATICGYSPRMRLDVVVNNLTVDALKDGEIEIKTPDLYRPHCHIQDVTDLYLFLLARPHLQGPYNAGFQNQTIMETAQLIAKHTGCHVKAAPHVPGKFDKRSYLVDSSLLLAQGFRPAFKVEDAIQEIVGMWRAGGLWDDERWHNLAYMVKQGLVRGAG